MASIPESHRSLPHTPLHPLAHIPPLMDISGLEDQVAFLQGHFSTSESRLLSLSTAHPPHHPVFTSVSTHIAAGVTVLGHLLTDLKTAPGTVNLSSTDHCLKALVRYSDQLASAIESCERPKVKKRFIGELQVVDKKLETLFEIVDSAAKQPQTDLFSLSKSTPRWQSLYEIATIHAFPRPQSLQKHINKMVLSIVAGNAFVSKAFEKTGTSRKLMLGIGMVYYNIDKKRALRKARISFANPNIDIAKAVWNLMDTKLMATVMEKLAVGITVNRLIYVPIVTEGDVRMAIRNDEGPRGTLGDEAGRVVSGFREHSQGEGGEVPVRILAPFEVPGLRRPGNKCGCCGAMHIEHKPLSLKAVIFHIHGGGFIAMSSRSHQNYTRRWANSTQTIIFSVDYRLAPEHCYPAALDDVWAAYLWVMGYAKRQLGIQFEKVVVTGDSAGGNLACGLINKAIESGVEGLVPHGALLTYPALYLAPARYTPSFERALEDLIVHHTFLRLCLESYVPSGSDPVNDHLISPLVTPLANLQRFPRVRMMVGSDDPLEDDAWRFAERLRSSGVDVKLIEFEGMPHGFLGFDLKVNGVKEARIAVDKGSALLEELILGE